MYNVNVVDVMVRQIVNTHLYSILSLPECSKEPLHTFLKVFVQSNLEVREHFVWETNNSLCKLMLQRPRNVCSGAIHDEYTFRTARRNNESPAKNLCKWRYLVKKLSPLIALFSWKRRKILYVSHFLFDFSDKPPTQRKVALHSCSS